mmetsp:Transcript_71092/g.140921  ORF Transcript_71092/g.140921 Transcript_71092/m.140921 type:complete len:98 (+) Transcript_71092:312-605(+)
MRGIEKSRNAGTSNIFCKLAVLSASGNMHCTMLCFASPRQQILRQKDKSSNRHHHTLPGTLCIGQQPNQMHTTSKQGLNAFQGRFQTQVQAVASSAL